MRWPVILVLLAACGQQVDYTPGRVDAVACMANTSVPAGDNIVTHDACLIDSDCGSGEACVCGTPSNVCAPAGCTTDADCAGGAGCVEVQLAPCGGPAVECQSAADECRTSDDCPIVGESRRASGVYASDERHTVCAPTSCPE